MKLLFLCSQNKRRSLTAEKIFDGYNGHEARSAGTESNARVKVTSGLLGWAEIIFCMEKKQLRRIKEKYSDTMQLKKWFVFISGTLDGSVDFESYERKRYFFVIKWGLFLWKHSHLIGMSRVHVFS